MCIRKTLHISTYIHKIMLNRVNYFKIIDNFNATLRKKLLTVIFSNFLKILLEFY